MDRHGAGRGHLRGPPAAAAAAARAPEPLRGRAFVVVEAAYLGDADPGAELIGPLRRLGPELDTFAPIPPSALAELNMDPGQPIPFQGNAAFLSDFPAAAIDALVGLAGLLREKQPGFSAALESALKLLELEPWPAQMPAETTATRAAVRHSRQPGEALSPCRTPGAARQLRRLRGATPVHRELGSAGIPAHRGGG
jgi:hypothetical protein